MKTIRKRRLEGKTDYKLRLGLLKSKLPRLVIRKTNRYITAQIVESKVANDFVLIGKNTKDLLGLGWPAEKSGSLKSKAAAYSLGLVIAKLAKEKKIINVIVDIGMYRNVHKSRVYSVIAGAIAGGLKLNATEKVIPSKEELTTDEKIIKFIEKLNK
jgi:large subunit ribosomal protein L18